MPRELPQRFEQHVLGAQVEVVGRLVEQQEIGRPQQHARQRVAVALAAREHADALEDVVVGKQETAEQGAQARLVAEGRGRDAGEVVEQPRVRIERLVLVLREVVGLHVVPQAEFAGRHRLLAGQQLDERGFARAVHAHQGDAVAAIDDEVHAREDALRRRSFWPRRGTPPPCARSPAAGETRSGWSSPPAAFRCARSSRVP